MEPSKEEVLAAIREHGSQTSAAAALKVTTHYVRKALGTAHVLKAPTRHDDELPKRGGRTLESFREEFDREYVVMSRVTTALQELGDTWLYELEFSKAACVSLAELAQYRDRFAEYIVHLKKDGRRAWAGSPELAKQMQAMV